jgi:PAS domain S-box-containing protein
VIEWQIKRRDGQFIPVEISAKILPDGRWVGFVRDIAERKRVEQALLQSEESLRRAQRVARLGSWDWDLRSDVVTRSPEFLAILGVGESYARAGALELMHLVAPEDRQRVLDEVYRAVRDVGSFTCEVRILRPDGCETFVLQQGEVITDENGAPARLVGTVLDITERKHIEQQREASYRWLRTVLDQAAVGLLLVQAPPDARIDANARALAMIGRPIERIDQYPGLLGTPDGKPVAGDQLPSARTLRGERLDSVEYVLHRADGTSIPVLASAAPIFGDDGRVLGGVVAFQDVSAAKELERLRAEWGSVVAHDLRQPINTIALTSALLSRTAHDPRLDRAFRQIDAAARRLDRMVGDLMDLSRLEARRLELQREPIDVAAAVRASVERMAPQAPEDRPIEIHVHDDPPRAYADPDRVAQVVENLLTNAVKYGSPGTPIALDVGRDDGAVAVEVTNDGRPLSREECDRLFQRFYRTQQGRVSGIAGTGLGLYIARELVEAHGGRIGVASSPAGKNTFRFTLPAAS